MGLNKHIYKHVPYCRNYYHHQQFILLILSLNRVDTFNTEVFWESRESNFRKDCSNSEFNYLQGREHSIVTEITGF